MVRAKNCRIIVLGIVVSLWFGFFAGEAPAQTHPSATPVVVPYFPLPERLELCGEVVPLNNEDVRERLDREFTIVVYNHAQVYLWLKRKERFFPWLEKQLALNKLPDDLKYVAVAESDLQLSAASPAGAVGPWQFIASTGAIFGLEQTKQIDERHDFELATMGAFRYLQKLYGDFRNWTLAIAAYNCGEKRVLDELERQKVDSYYFLKLPQETERYIFRILAIKEILTYPERYGYSLPKGAGYSTIRAERVNVRLSHAMPIQSLAEAAQITYREFKVLNPALVSDTVPQGTCTLKVPEGKGKEFLGRLEAVTDRAVPEKQTPARPKISYHKVARGDTLSAIASRYDVNKADLRQWNNLHGDKILLGQNIKIMK
ncbi:MAG: transglycosylase SLT domain-containing protein [Syntrophobacteraceae bacterium]